MKQQFQITEARRRLHSNFGTFQAKTQHCGGDFSAIWVQAQEEKSL
jgi:hypothetical protein